ncbi:hypothetical protein [Celerinatantimonas sp. YJH-8]|uniref:hypothetical protein n=1 Tax=Celerinatantimonas sp. YJH-8 TaxID=3228714 RepID=UPI0038C6D0A1
MKNMGLDWHMWYPQTVRYQRNQGRVLWRYLADKRFTEPFFSDTLRTAKAQPRWSTWQQLSEIAATLHSVGEPTGFIFHTSRCGSTLMAQMLARLSSNIVIAEAPVIDMALRANAFEPDIPREIRIHRLKTVLSIMGQRRSTSEQRLFIKFDAWNIAEWPLIEQAYPHVPKLFLYREPLAILVSHQRRCGMHMIPQWLKGNPFDQAAEGLSFHEYGAWVLSALFNAAIGYAAHHPLLCVNYAEIAARADAIFSFFNMAVNSDEIQAMKSALRYDAKAPDIRYNHTQAYQTDQAPITDELRHYAEKWLAKPYQTLEGLKTSTAT